MTARHALARLEREGLVERRPGGRYFRSPAIYVVGFYRSERHTLFIRRFRQDGRRNRLSPIDLQAD
jgi:DNA-binding GntR family transcriptional regulator